MLGHYGIRRATYHLLSHYHGESRFHHIFHLFLISLITANVLAAVLETTHSINENHLRLLHLFDIVSVTLFSVEWLARVWTCVEDPRFSDALVGRVRFILTPLMVADLVAILPFYLPMVMVVDLRFLRLFRLFHIFRLYAERDDLRNGG